MTRATSSKKLNVKSSVEKVLKVLSARNSDMLAARYGIGSGSRSTLESIGRRYNITRERVRQIEEASYIKIRNSEHFELLQPSVQEVDAFIRVRGGVVTEYDLMHGMVSEVQQPYLALLMALSDQFVKIKESDEYKNSWAIDEAHADAARKIFSGVIAGIEKNAKPLSEEELLALVHSVNESSALTDDSAHTVLTLSKHIQRGPFGKWGLASWAEISPRGVRDKAYLVSDREERPLHFREIARLIDAASFGKKSTHKKTHPQTVHNELIKDSRFVLVGRGIYALDKWGYTPGTVKDVIVDIMKREGQSLHKEAIVSKVLEQRMVQKNTIFLNLQNKDYFTKTEEGQYYLA